ncbi:MAG: cell division protein ZapA [Deltaproteobacteria bacterium]|nr:cell division protein ZapA [Deltaproteobacteria bacterium]TLN01543.1 MAG: cell division protein ZapA [bacterium]
MSSLHRVKVFGREVQVRSSASAEEVREVESLVNDTIAQVQTSMKTTDFQILAILALLNVAESLLLQSRECSRQQYFVRERISRLMRHIDEAVVHD